MTKTQSSKTLFETTKFPKRLKKLVPLFCLLDGIMGITVNNAGKSVTE